MKLKFRPPGTKRLKLKCDILVSTSASKFNLRRYITGAAATAATPPASPSLPSWDGSWDDSRDDVAVIRLRAEPVALAPVQGGGA
jgi:hypothetical protein